MHRNSGKQEPTPLLPTFLTPVLTYKKPTSAEHPHALTPDTYSIIVSAVISLGLSVEKGLRQLGAIRNMSLLVVAGPAWFGWLLP